MLLDDHPAVGYALACTVEEAPHLQVVGNFNSSRALLLALAHQAADLVITDYALGPHEPDGSSLIRRIRARRPACRILVISSHFDPLTVVMALRAGANGFIGKSQKRSDLIEAIDEVLRGDLYLHQNIRAQLPSFYANNTRPMAACGQRRAAGRAHSLPGYGLTAKEHEVVRCILAGMSISEIAAKFHRQASTISTQKRSAFNKLGVSDVLQLVNLYAHARR